MELPAVSRKLLSAPRLPLVARAAALTLLVGVSGALAVYLFSRQSTPVVPPDEPVLQGEVTGIFSGFKYLHTEGNKDKYLLTAAVDKAYANGAHELTTVELVSFGANSDRNDRLMAERAVYDPSKALVVFESNVRVETTDGMRVETDRLRYNQETGVVDMEGAVRYARRNLTGTCTGAVLETNEERLRMLRDVDMMFHADDSAPTAADPVKREPPAAAPVDAPKKAGKKGGKKGGGKKGGGKKKKKEAAAAGAEPVIDFASGPRIPVRIRSAAATFDKKAGVARFEGGAVATRASDEMRGATLVAFVAEDNRIERVEARGDAYLKAAGRAEANAPDIDFHFAEGNQLERAVATGGARVHWLGDPPDRVVTGERVELTMRPGAQGAELHQAVAEGRAVVTIAAPAQTPQAPNPSARELTADRVEVKMHEGGQFAKKAIAEGNAVLLVTPVKAEPGADRKKITAGRMEIHFHETANLAREFSAEGGVRVDFEPLTKDGRALRTTTSRAARADFERESQDVARLEQSGEFKYVEGERNATAERAVYTRADGLIALRGGRPNVWDAKARTQADEIDLRPSAAAHQGRGDVRTTYYSPESTGNAVPFGNTKSPVFITASRLDAAEADGGSAVYTGAARAWQDDNYAKADTIRLFNSDRRMEAEGSVETGLYRFARKGENGATEVVPVFTTASKMRYSDAERTLHYEGGVVSRQAPSELRSDTQDLWLTRGQDAQVDRMIAAGSVVMTEPGRTGTGDKLVYTASDQKVVLTGSSARVEDAQEGTSTGSELTYFVGGDRVRSTGRGAGRVRTTHRIRKEGQ